MGQTFYKLDGETIPFIRADIHLISKGKEKEKETVSPAVTAERDIIIDDEERQDVEKAKDEWHKNIAKMLDPEEARKKKEMEGVLERARVKKMNKTARVKHQAKREAEAEATKIKEELAKAEERAKEAEAAGLKEEKEQRRQDKLTTGGIFKTRKKGGG